MQRDPGAGKKEDGRRGAARAGRLERRYTRNRREQGGRKAGGHELW